MVLIHVHTSNVIIHSMFILVVFVLNNHYLCLVHLVSMRSFSTLVNSYIYGLKLFYHGAINLF